MRPDQKAGAKPPNILEIGAKILVLRHSKRKKKDVPEKSKI